MPAENPEFKTSMVFHTSYRKLIVYCQLPIAKLIYHISNGLNRTTGLVSRKKPGNGNKDFFQAAEGCSLKEFFQTWKMTNIRKQDFTKCPNMVCNSQSGRMG